MESKDKTNITFYQGMNVIGGTLITVQYRDSIILFDIGSSFNPDIEAKMPDFKTQTLINYQIMPDLGDFYTGRQKPHLVRKNTAVLVSHAHLDHSRMLNYLNLELPVYATAATKQIINYLNEDGQFLLPASFLDEQKTRPIIGVKPTETIKVGEISVTFCPVDHDVLGASGLIIKTPTAKIAYTGDLRRHGFEPELTDQFIDQAKNCDVLISEAVSFSFGAEKKNEFANEADLITAVKKIIDDNPEKMISFKTYPANLKRTIAFDFGENNPRTTVYTAKTAQIMKEITGKDEHFYKIGNNFSEKMLDPKFEIPYHWILKGPKKYFFEIGDNYTDLVPGSIYLHSDAEPLGPFDPQFQPFLDRLQKLGVLFASMSCSGHAHQSDLNLIVGEIEPKILIPIHSFHPELLENPNGERMLPRPGQILSL